MLLQFSANAAFLKPTADKHSSNRLRRCAANTVHLSPLWSSDEPPSDCSTGMADKTSQRPVWHTRVLSTINESTKWTVSATVLTVLLWQHNEYAAWCVVGAVMSSFLCKVLKHVLNHERPDNAPKSDPGMPSSHANSLIFLAVYAALALAHHSPHSSAAQALGVVVLCLGVFKTWLRVHLGFHTWPQVVVGAALGASTAAAWFKLGTAWALPALQQSPAGLGVLYAVTGLGSAAFALRIVSSWWGERRAATSSQLAEQARPQHHDDDEAEQLLSQQAGSALRAELQLGAAGLQARPVVEALSPAQA